MKVEILFREVCNLFGDTGNITYLSKCLPAAKFTYTTLLDEPKFVHEKIDFIYLGPMSETMQLKVIAKLKPYQQRIKDLINSGTIFLFTGNAVEILGQEIIIASGEQIKGLEIFNLVAHQHMESRYNSLIKGDFQDQKIIGCISTFTTLTSEEPAFIKAVKAKNDATTEGIHVKNFFGTTVLGPILVNNPYFTKYLLGLLGIKNKLPFEDELVAAYEQKLAEYQNPNTKY